MITEKPKDNASMPPMPGSSGMGGMFSQAD
jgi:hypothetical protein